ncbi:endogenous retrovirus group FC1 Env polyprotein-like [Mustela lutreola]|uniref:endogenous retrovirus group FC1 Env polyprotein-like n=1 Tax=Mustela lutreola TaxID=9666 RepID=UPI00279727FD|nr:endogenous retrovirus group FC1 Env polyprotein-like [Mustela lutreola]
MPRFGLSRTLQSDNGPAFISSVAQQVAESLNITWKLHIPYHPQSSAFTYMPATCYRGKEPTTCIVTSKIKELRDRIQARRRDTSSWGLDPYNWVTWLLPLAGPVCIIQELARVSVNQLLLQPCSRLPTSDYPYDATPCQQEVARTELRPLTPLY